MSQRERQPATQLRSTARLVGTAAKVLPGPCGATLVGVKMRPLGRNGDHCLVGDIRILFRNCRRRHTTKETPQIVVGIAGGDGIEAATAPGDSGMEKMYPQRASRRASVVT